MVAGYFKLTEGTAPGTPSTSQWNLYFKSDGLYIKDDAGVETKVSSTGDITADTLALTNATELTIASGVVTATQSYHSIDTEGDASTDDLDTINGGTAGDVLIIFAVNDARDVVVKNGTGNILTFDGSDITLDEDHKLIMLLSDGTNWRQVGGSGGGGSSSPLTTKGDIWVYSTADARLPVGTEGQYLTANSAETTGLKWINPSPEAGGIVVIDSQTLGSSASSVTFNSIPQTFEHLRVVAFVESDIAGNQDNLIVDINSDTTNSNYVFVVRQWQDSTSLPSDGALRIVGNTSGNTSPANNFCYNIIDIANYTDTTVQKVLFSRVGKAESDTENLFADFMLQWKNASAITSLNFTPQTGTNFVTGTKFVLYGIVGSASAIGGTVGTTDNAIPRADGTGGNTLQGSGVLIDDNDKVTIQGGSGVDTDSNLEIKNNAGTLTAKIQADGNADFTGITLDNPLPVAEGGTGADTAGVARTNLGLAIGTDVQAYDADLTTLATLVKTKGNLIVANGTNWVALGVGTNTQVLTADSAEASGIKWATPAGGGGATLVSTNATYTAGSDYTSTSTTFVDVDATNLIITATLNGGDVLVTMSFSSKATGASSDVQYRITDGTNNSNAFGLLQSSEAKPMTISHVFSGISGSTTFKLQYRRVTGTVEVRNTSVPFNASLLEIS